MKIIASTKILSIEIDRAINKNLNRFALYSKTEIFKIYSNVLYQEFCIGCLEKGETFISKFNHLQWYKVSEFLKQLPEQPIVLEIEKINDDEIDIKLSQFIHRL